MGFAGTAIVDFLNDLGDVEVPSPADKAIFYYDAASGLWKARLLNQWTLAQLGAKVLGDLDNVNAPSPSDGYVLAWDAATSMWIAQAVAKTFLALTDTPSSYSGQAGKVVRVNAAENALEFLALGKTFTTITATILYYMGSQTATPRTATVSSVSGDVITLTAAVAYRFGSTDMNNNAYLKIANTSKSPVQYAWVKTRPASNQLQVTSAADISTWVNGNTISTAYNGATSTWIELDISPTIPANATFVLGGGYATMAEAVDSADAFMVSEAPTTAKAMAIRPQVNGLRIEAYPGVPIITEQRLYVMDRGTANPVFSSGYWVTGYFS